MSDYIGGIVNYYLGHGRRETEMTLVKVKTISFLI